MTANYQYTNDGTGKRKEMSEALHKSIDDLESLTDKRWAYDAKDE